MSTTDNLSIFAIIGLCKYVFIETMYDFVSESNGENTQNRKAIVLDSICSDG